MYRYIADTVGYLLNNNYSLQRYNITYWVGIPVCKRYESEEKIRS